MYEIKVVSESEIHIFTYIPMNVNQIVYNGEKYDLVQMLSDQKTRKRTHHFCKNYF